MPWGAVYNTSGVRAIPWRHMRTCGASGGDGEVDCIANFSDLKSGLHQATSITSKANIVLNARNARLNITSSMMA